MSTCVSPEVTHCFWKHLSFFVFPLLCDFHASQCWRCWNVKKIIPLGQNSSQGDGFKWFSTANAPTGNSLKRTCCIQFHLCWVERDLTQLSQYLGQLISLTLMLMKQGLRPVPSECKDNVPATFKDDRIRLPVLNTSELLLSALELSYLLSATEVTVLRITETWSKIPVPAKLQRKFICVGTFLAPTVHTNTW